MSRYCLRGNLSLPLFAREIFHFHLLVTLFWLPLEGKPGKSLTRENLLLTTIIEKNLWPGENLLLPLFAHKSLASFCGEIVSFHCLVPLFWLLLEGNREKSSTSLFVGGNLSLSDTL
ncbi:hypothetical protein AMTRI_Chr07g79970 [Amborella trichopoda]